MEGRTIVLVSHHIQLTARGAEYVVGPRPTILDRHKLTSLVCQVELENGRVKYEGDAATFLADPRFKTLEEEDGIEEKTAEAAAKAVKSPPQAKNKRLELVSESTFVSETSSASEAESESDSDGADEAATKLANKPARKLIEDETKAVGHVALSVWLLYLGLSGGTFYWVSFVFAFGGAKLSDVAQTYWLNLWCAMISSSFMRLLTALPMTRSASCETKIGSC